MTENYTDLNAAALDRWVANGWEWGRPITHATFQQAKAGSWQLLLTPQKPAPQSWYAPFLTANKLPDVDVLGLASGGAQQMPIFAAVGAHATVLDYADSQLNSERDMAARENYPIQIVKADMTKRLPFADASFDLIFHPIANVYVEDVQHIWDECYRVLRPGGVLLAGLDNGLNFLLDTDEKTNQLVARHKLPYNPLKDPQLLAAALADTEDGSVQFSHSLTDQIGGQLQAGFRLTNLLEDRDQGGPISEYAPQYLLTRAVKPE